MIWPTQALLLASTKLKTRQIRLFVTVVITALLFAVLVFVALVTEGAVHSVKSFNEEGYGNKFLVQAVPSTYSWGMGSDQAVLDEFMPMQRDLVERKKQLAKKLELQYDPASDHSLPLTEAKFDANRTEYYPNWTNPQVAAFLEKRNTSIPGTDFQEFRKTAERSGAKAVHSGTISNMMSFSPQAPSVQVLVDGKEDFKQFDGRQGFSSIETGVETIKGGWRTADAELLRPFVLEGQSMTIGKDGSIPVIAPFSAAEQILGLKALPQTAMAKQKLARLQEVRQKVAGTTAQLCYRNGASAALLQQALQQEREIASRKGEKDYVPPPLQYAVPSDACSAVVVKSDKRTAEEKKQDEKQRQFDTAFATVEEPGQGTVTIRIIGLNPDTSYPTSMNVATILSSILTSNAGSGWVSPAAAAEQNPLAMTMTGGTARTAPRSSLAYYAEFPDLAQMERFVKDQACDGARLMQAGGQTMIVPNGMESPERMIENCINMGKVFTVSPYGNSAGAIEQFRREAWKFARIAALVVVVIASLVLMGNIGKIIADSRRETAVFRALGATRLDIAQIYLTYTVLLGMLVIITAAAFGALAALWVNNRYSPELSVSSVLAYNAQDIDRKFVLFGLNPLYLAAIAGLILLAGLISASLPLLASMSRNPIRDMRDDT